jgi:hypothetical protein
MWLFAICFWGGWDHSAWDIPSTENMVEMARASELSNYAFFLRVCHVFCEVRSTYLFVPLIVCLGLTNLARRFPTRLISRMVHGFLQVMATLAVSVLMVGVLSVAWHLAKCGFYDAVGVCILMYALLQFTAPVSWIVLLIAMAPLEGLSNASEPDARDCLAPPSAVTGAGTRAGAPPRIEIGSADTDKAVCLEGAIAAGAGAKNGEYIRIQTGSGCRVHAGQPD